MLDKSIPYLIDKKRVFDQSFCQSVIKQSKKIGFVVAPIHTNNTTYYDPSVRRNERVLINEGSLHSVIENAVNPLIPKSFLDAKFIGLNDLLRVYRYRSSMDFKPHIDNTYKDSRGESRMTVLIYLNSVKSGGETCIITEPEINIKPEQGRVAIFQHGLAASLNGRSGDEVSNPLIDPVALFLAIR